MINCSRFGLNVEKVWRTECSRLKSYYNPIFSIVGNQIFKVCFLIKSCTCVVFTGFWFNKSVWLKALLLKWVVCSSVWSWVPFKNLICRTYHLLFIANQSFNLMYCDTDGRFICSALPWQLVEHLGQILRLVLLLLLGHLFNRVGHRLLHVTSDGVDAGKQGPKGLMCVCQQINVLSI